MLKPEDFVKSKLVDLGWRFGYAYGGHLAGEMVMSALASRFRAGWGSFLEVLEGVPNFMAENEIPPLILKTTWEPGFTKLLHSVDGIYDGAIQDKAKGGVYWCDTNKVEREWFKTKVLNPIDPVTGLRRHPMVANMGSLSFFK